MNRRGTNAYVTHAECPAPAPTHLYLVLGSSARHHLRDVAGDGGEQLHGLALELGVRGALLAELKQRLQPTRLGDRHVLFEQVKRSEAKRSEAKRSEVKPGARHGARSVKGVVHSKKKFVSMIQQARFATEQSINQSTNQSTNQSINRSINQ